MSTVYISLGSNLGDRLGYLYQALDLMKQQLHFEQASFLYETDPVGVTDQNLFLNIVTKWTTEYSPQDLLEIFEKIMKDMGRMRTEKWGPRIIDIDILLYDDLVITTDTLIVPHPRMHERSFVLVPLCDIDPKLVHPLLRKSMQTLLQELNTQPLH